jgi:transcriptional regulator with PAS, ATPase and Fis domain
MGLLDYSSKEDSHLYELPIRRLEATEPNRQTETLFVIHKTLPFLERPAEPRALEMLRHHAIRRERVLEEPGVPECEMPVGGVLGELVGTSPAMQAIFSIIRQVAPTSAPVLICGETGTGKELVAREIHKLSPRGDGPFVAINAAALPEALIESELFGHERGAFTGAMERRAGCFEQAHGGTLFLDEIGEMPVHAQSKLLRVLEDLRVRRLGGKSEIPVNARVLAATSHSVVAHLREEIYYRLSVFEIVIPPLRERKEDIPLIAEVMIQNLNKKHGARVTGIDSDVLNLFVAYNWPGNIRELRNVIERATIVASVGAIRPHHLPSPSFDMRSGRNTPEPSHINGRLTLQPGQPLSYAEEAYIKLTLEYVNNNRRRAAEILGVGLRTLQSRIGGFRKEAKAAAIGS